MAHEAQVSQGSTVSSQTKQKAERESTPARKAAENLRSAAAATDDEYRGRTEGIRDNVLHRIGNFQDESKQYVRKNPTKAVFIALGVGFVVGLIFRR